MDIGYEPVGGNRLQIGYRSAGGLCYLRPALFVEERPAGIVDQHRPGWNPQGQREGLRFLWPGQWIQKIAPTCTHLRETKRLG
jgi:hypothetical protein